MHCASGAADRLENVANVIFEKRTEGTWVRVNHAPVLLGLGLVGANTDPPPLRGGARVTPDLPIAVH